MKTALLCTYVTPFNKRRIKVSRCLKSISLLFLFSILFLSSKNFAQVGTGVAPMTVPSGGFHIDGDLQANTPTVDIGDWLGNPGGTGDGVLDASGNPIDAATTFHLTDLYDSGVDDNFSGSHKKVDDDPNLWQWTNNPVNDKEDINNALVHFSKSADNHLWVVVASDRLSTNGDAYIDFEFLQNKLTVNSNGTFSSDGPDGGRTVNDFLITLELTNGGGAANFFVERWQETSPGVFDYEDATTEIPGGSTFAAVNPADGTPVPFGAFGNTTYQKNAFVEAAIDLTALVGNFGPCVELGIKSIFIKTKESQSPSATIVDFVAPSLPVDLTIGVADAGAAQSKCSEGTTTDFQLHGSATPPPNDAIASTVWSFADGTGTIDNGNTLTPTVHVTSASATLRLTVTMVNQVCSPEVHDDVVLTVNAVPTADAVATDVKCNGGNDGSVDLTVSGGSGNNTFAWTKDGDDDFSATTEDLSNVSAGTYHVTVTAGGCSTTASATVNQPASPLTASAEEGTIKCHSDQTTVTITASGGTAPYTNDGEHTVSAGPYSFTVSDANGCTYEVSGNITAPDALTASAEEGTISCHGGTTTVTITASGGTAPYSGDGEHTVSAGDYSFVVTDGGGCTYEVSGNISEPDALSASASATAVKCNGQSNGSVDLTVSGGTPGYSFLWSNGATSEDLSGVAANSYSVTVTDANHCTTTASATVSQPAVLSCSAVQNSQRGCSTTVNDGSATVTGSGGNGGYSYLWDDGETSATATQLSAGSHSVTVTDSKGCTSSCSVTIGQRVCTGIYPTSTSCAGYNSGTIQFLSKICVTTQKKKGSSSTTVSNATPGVFFYYTKFNAPSATFDVYVDQTQCSSLNKAFAIASGQIFAYKDNCTKLATGAQATIVGDGTIHITKATVGQPVIIGVKYDVKSIVGATATGVLPCTATFETKLVTTTGNVTISGTQTSLSIAANCSVAAVAAESLSQSNEELRITAYPNPYKDKVNFRFTSPVSGKALLEAYDLTGRKLATIYSGNVDAGVERTVTYNVPAGTRVEMMYKLTVGDKSYHSILLAEK